MAKDLFKNSIFNSDFNSLANDGFIDVEINNNIADFTPKTEESVKDTDTTTDSSQSTKQQVDEVNGIKVVSPEEMLKDENLEISKLEQQQLKDKDKVQQSTKTKETQKEIKGTEDTPGSVKDIKISPYAMLLKNRGILPNLNEESFSKLKPEEQVEALLEAQDEEVNNRVVDWIEGLPEKLKFVLKNHVDGVPLENLIKTVDNIDKYSGIKEEDLIKDDKLMEKILLDDKMSAGLTKEEAEIEIENLVDKEKPSKAALKRLIKNEQLSVEKERERVSRERAEFQRRNEESVKQVSKLINDTNELIPGITLSDRLKKNLSESMFQPVDFDDKNRPISKVLAVRNQDPVKFEMILHHLVDITKGFTDWSLLSKSAKTQAVLDMEKELSSETLGSGTAVRVQKETDQKKRIVSTLQKMFG